MGHPSPPAPSLRSRARSLRRLGGGAGVTDSDMHRIGSGAKAEDVAATAMAQGVGGEPGDHKSECFRVSGTGAGSRPSTKVRVGSTGPSDVGGSATLDNDRSPARVRACRLHFDHAPPSLDRLGCPAQRVPAELGDNPGHHSFACIYDRTPPTIHKENLSWRK